MCRLHIMSVIAEKLLKNYSKILKGKSFDYLKSYYFLKKD
jgi:hypothetical protein